MVTNRTLSTRLLGVVHTREIVDEIFGESLHAKRVLSLANGVAGVLAATMAFRARDRPTGRAYAALNGTTTKSGVKQIDRLLSNDGLALDLVQGAWARFVAGSTRELVVAMDWTDFEAGQEERTRAAAGNARWRCRRKCCEN